MTQQQTRAQRTRLTVTPELTAQRRWYVVNADGQVLGRLASRVASVLRGKHTPDFTPQADAGDCVVVINAEKIRVTGNKRQQKRYTRYTGYPGGLRHRTFQDTIQRDARVVIEHAVQGMLPKNRLGRDLLRKLHVYNGPHHKHQAQQPQPLVLP